MQAVPGPGQYNVPSMLQTGPTFTMAKRTPRKETKKDVPGVGTYEHLSSDQGNGPAFTAAARPAAFSAAEDMPGPGAYFDYERDRHASQMNLCACDIQWAGHVACFGWSWPVSSRPLLRGGCEF